MLGALFQEQDWVVPVVRAGLCVASCGIPACAVDAGGSANRGATDDAQEQFVGGRACERVFDVDQDELWLQRKGMSPQRLQAAICDPSVGRGESFAETVWMWRTREDDADGLCVREFRRCSTSVKGEAKDGVLARRFVVEGLRADWALVVRVSLVRADGRVIELFVNGASVPRAGECAEIEIPLARDEATRLEYR